MMQKFSSDPERKEAMLQNLDTFLSNAERQTGLKLVLA